MGTFKEGYEGFAKSAGAMGAAIQSDDYIKAVNKEIAKLLKAINEELAGNPNVATTKGFAAEYWHAGTYNVNAALNGSARRASVAKDVRGILGSPDIVGDAGKAGLKYYGNAEATAKQQAKSLFERYNEYKAGCARRGASAVSFEEYSKKVPGMKASDPLYGGQIRIVPKDQLEDAVKYLKKKIAKESVTRPAEVERLKDTLALMRDKLEDSKGNESIPLSEAEAEKIAKAAAKGKFDPKDFGISTEELMRWDHVARESIKAGLAAAAITAAIKTAPELLKIIRHLDETGELDVEQLKKTGHIALSSGGTGLVRGALSAAVTTVCKAGFLGEALKAVSPSVVGGIVVFAMDAAKGGFEVVAGKKDNQEFKREIAEEAFSTVGAVVAGGTLNKFIPGIGYLIGNLIGAMLGAYVYHVITHDTGMDRAVAYFREQVQLFEEYAAELLCIDFVAFKKTADIYIAAADDLWAARDESELNTCLKRIHEQLGFSLPWQGDFDAFMQSDAHLVFE